MDLVLANREGDGFPSQPRNDSRMLMLNGAPIDESIVTDCPFVVNSKLEITQPVEN